MEIHRSEDYVIDLGNGTELAWEGIVEQLVLRRVDVDSAGNIVRVHRVPVEPALMRDALDLMERMLKSVPLPRVADNHREREKRRKA